MQLALALNYLVSLAWFLFSEFYGRPDLQIFEHISYIVPNLFLAVGANLSLLEKVTVRQYASLVLLLTAALVLPLGVPWVTARLVVVPWWGWCGAAGLALAVLARGIRRPGAAAPMAGWILAGIVCLVSGSIPDEKCPPTRSRPSTPCSRTVATCTAVSMPAGSM